MINRLGVFGGMFDPVHTGHIQAAKYARQLLSLDLVKLVPCASPNHRSPARASARHRLRMLEMLTATEPALEVDAQEIERPGTSYSVDTLAALRETGNAAQIVFILGEDAFVTLTHWHEWQRLVELCHLLVLGRPAGDGSRLSVPAELQARVVANKEALFSSAAGKVLIAGEFSMLVSSSEVRRRLAAGDDVSDCLDPQVQRYIREQQLYR